MRTILFLLLSIQVLSSQTDLFRQKFIDKLHSIADGADAVVGIAVKDLRTGEQFLINEKEVFPTASSIKIFIAAEVYRQAAEGKFSLTDVRTIPASVRAAGSGVLSMLDRERVSMSIRDYCVLMMNVSDNTATNLLIDLVGMHNVSAFAAKNGCSSTKLQRVMMDAKAAKEGRENISSPADLVTILGKLYAGEIVSKQASDDILSIMRLEKDGWLKSGLPSGTGIANKAGDIDGIKCDAGVVYLQDSPYIIAVMTKMLLHDADGGPVITAVSNAAFQFLERKANSNQFGRRIAR
jgi:beta-lactamase class A